MGSNNIKGLTVEIGGDVSKLTDSLKSVDTQLKSSASELRQVDKLLKLLVELLLLMCLNILLILQSLNSPNPQVLI